MLNSIKSWLNLPAQIKRFKKRDGTGYVEYAEPSEHKCYVAGKLERVTNTAGVEVTSSTQFYFDGCVAVDVLDLILFEGREYSIVSVSTFYRNGKPDIKVVYT